MNDLLFQFFQVQAVTVHATNNYFVTASLDGSWCFYELSSGTCLTQVWSPFLCNTVHNGKNCACT